MAILVRLSQGPEVSRIQRLLSLLKLYTGPQNGVFDARTEEAVMKFQQIHGLKVDGKVGPITQAKFTAVFNTPAEQPSTSQTLKGRLLIVDLGHGQNNSARVGDPGAVDPPNKAENDTIDTREDDLVFLYGQLFVKRLKDLGATVVETRPTDNFVSLNDRVRIANKYPNAIAFVSLHTDAGSVTAMGLSALVCKANNGAAHKLAKRVVEEMRKAGYPVHGTGIFERPNLAVLRGTNMPAVLFELGFISNPKEEINLHNPTYRQGLVEVLIRAVVAEFGVKV